MSSLCRHIHWLIIVGAQWTCITSIICGIWKNALRTLSNRKGSYRWAINIKRLTMVNDIFAYNCSETWCHSCNAFYYMSDVINVLSAANRKCFSRCEGHCNYGNFNLRNPPTGDSVPKCCRSYSKQIILNYIRNY